MVVRGWVVCRIMRWFVFIVVLSGRFSVLLPLRQLLFVFELAWLLFVCFVVSGRLLVSLLSGWLLM